MGKKYVYMFNEGAASMRELLGGKGANLAEMTNMGLPIPQGFTVTTEACTYFNENGKELSDEIREQIEDALNFWRKKPAKNWETTKILFLFQFVREPEPLCRE